MAATSTANPTTTYLRVPRGHRPWQCEPPPDAGGEDRAYGSRVCAGQVSGAWGGCVRADMGAPKGRDVVLRGC